MKNTTLNVQLLEEAADGLRLVSFSNSDAECLLFCRKSLDENNEIGGYLDIPGVYILVGPPASSEDPKYQRLVPRLYIGQADSVRSRLNSHLRDEKKAFWQSTAVIRRDEKRPLEIGQCQFLESKLYKLALNDMCTLENGNIPREPHLAPSRKYETELFLQHAVVILTAMGFEFFTVEPVQRGAGFVATGAVNAKPVKPELSETVKSLIDHVKERVSADSYPDTEWYWRKNDLRAKVIAKGNSKVFMWMDFASNWVRVNLKNVGRFKMADPSDLDTHLSQINEAYAKALESLHKRTSPSQ